MTAWECEHKNCKKYEQCKEKYTDDNRQVLPCPFCGGEAVIIENYTGNEGYVECPHCHIGTQVYEYRELQEAIEAWNKRVSCDTCAMYFPNDGCMAGLAEGEVAE